ncbi:MAG: DUF4240 domain-containing protein [Chitinophagaceae bacterium]|nr:DUF4240 domain-containing protein [Chitinophagaceae bacterium]
MLFIFYGTIGIFMIIRSVTIALISISLACGQAGKKQNGNSGVFLGLEKNQKMDTTHFWKIMDNAFNIGGFENSLREDAILKQLISLTPSQIQDFEIIFQQMNQKASTWGNFAANTVIMGGSTDDGFYYFRCWLISLGQKNFEETLKNPDYLATLDIPVEKSHGLAMAEFEELISLSDQAYEKVTGKKPESDTTFPRDNAQRLGLFYDSGTTMKGVEWVQNDELPKIVPNLCKKYEVE